MKKLLTALAFGLALLTAVPAQGAMRITFDPGGSLNLFIDRYDAIHASGGKVIIDGPCISACTLITGLMLRENVCITKRASLGFHSASELNMLTGTKKYSKEGTQQMWGLFPDDVKMLVILAGWDGASEHEEVVFVRYEQLKGIYQDCK